ncbi:uncharacterized protein LOC124370411 [Homalodisca vitripennis]|uniref:uncharacterized protein LOC124370411 n=1 Tax=Homalodisca vitripennis TaxID=197043 RepID=UPI001EEBF9ED|nr:uncharacterized protein LOC124370411 [Homalodisca vitripennis]
MDTNPAPSLTSLQAVDPFVLLNNENEYIMEVESESNKEFATDENIVWNDGITNQDFQSYDISFSSQGLVAEEEDSLQELAVSGNADIPSPGTSVLSSNVDDTDIDSTYCPRFNSESELSTDESIVSIPRVASKVSSDSTSYVRRSQKIAQDKILLVPYTDSDTEEEANKTNPNVKKGKKRVRNENKWKKCVRKQLRVSGKNYLSAKGAEIKARSLKSPCKSTCRLKCYQRFTKDQREGIFSDFWREDRDWDSKRQFVVSCISSKPVARSRKKDGSKGNRAQSNKFSFQINSCEEIVCKTFFLNTLAISEMFMRISQQKTSKTGMVEPDQRGKHVPGTKIKNEIIDGIKSHISKYPAYQSHYSRERTSRKYLGNHLNINKMYGLYVEECREKQVNPAKKWLFSKVFNEDFNMAFKLPDNDTCDVCDEFECRLKNKQNSEELEEISRRHQEHLDEAASRYRLKREDKLHGKEDHKSKVVMADLQKCLPTPNLTNSQSFYLRKLWTLNYTIHDPANNKTWCMLWDEVTGGRGGSEMASCFYAWASRDIIESGIEKLTVWTDNCSGQNRNMNMILMYIWLLKTSPNLREINHKFLLPGHTHMEVDGQHSIIERAKKHISGNTIYTCNDWANFIASCKKKDPFEVKRMNLEDFLDFMAIVKGRKSAFVARKKNTDGEPFLISATVWLQLRSDKVGVLFYKTNFKNDTFKEVDLTRRSLRNQEVTMPTTIPQLRQSKKPISSQKYRDLMTILQWVPNEYKAYFQLLPHGEDAGDFPDEDSTSVELF